MHSSSWNNDRENKTEPRKLKETLERTLSCGTIEAKDV